MKKTIAGFLLFLSFLPARAEPPVGSFDWCTPLPLLAAVSDIVGVGSIVAPIGTNALINVSQYWVGNPQTNQISIRIDEGEALPPTGGTNFVFLLSQYTSFGDVEPLGSRFSYIFDMDYHRRRHLPDSLFFLGGDRSWIPVTPDNAPLISWCSNLVYVSQVNTDRQAFYELIRDGYRLNPMSSRINRDSDYTFMYFHYFNDTNFMQQIWSDTNLVRRARGWVNISYQQETGLFLPE